MKCPTPHVMRHFLKITLNFFIYFCHLNFWPPPANLGFFISFGCPVPYMLIKYFDAHVLMQCELFFFQVRKHCRHCGKYRMNASKLELYNYCPKKCPVPVPRMCPSNFSIFISLNPSNFLPIFVVWMMAPLSWTHAFSFPFHVQSPRNVHGLKFPFEVFTDQGYNNIIVRMLFLLMTEKSRFNQFHFLEFYEMFSITKKNPVPNF